MQITLTEEQRQQFELLADELRRQLADLSHQAIAVNAQLQFVAALLRPHDTTEDDPDEHMVPSGDPHA